MPAYLCNSTRSRVCVCIPMHRLCCYVFFISGLPVGDRFSVLDRASINALPVRASPVSVCSSSAVFRLRRPPGCCYHGRGFRLQFAGAVSVTPKTGSRYSPHPRSNTCMQASSIASATIIPASAPSQKDWAIVRRWQQASGTPALLPKTAPSSASVTTDPRLAC